MTVLLVSAVASAEELQGQQLLRLVDALCAHNVKPRVVLPFDGEGSLAPELKKRKLDIVPLTYGWWACESDAKEDMQQRSLLAAGMRWNDIAEKDLVRLCKGTDTRIVLIASGLTSVGLKVGKKLKIPVLWRFEEAIDGLSGGYAFIYSDAKAAKRLGSATCLVAANEKIAADLRGRAPESTVRTIPIDDSEALFALIRETSAGML